MQSPTTETHQNPGLLSDQAGNQPDTRRTAGISMSYSERYAAGKALRANCSRAALAEWKAPTNRQDAVDLVLQAEEGRMPELLPLRHGRMARSPFTFYRGAALTMTSDLASTPSSGI